MQARGRLVEDVERAPGVALRELERQLHALRLAARERRRRLAQPHIAQSDVDQRLQLPGDRRDRGEEAGRLAHGQLQHFVDVASLVAHLQRLAVVALAVAHVAGDVEVGQEMHLDLGDAVALAGLATAALDVEGEAPGVIPALACLGHAREQLPDGREQSRIGCRVGARRAADRALVDADRLVEVLQAGDRIVRRRLGGAAVEAARHRRIDRVVDERGLSRARYAGHAHQQPERQRQIDALQVVAGRAAHDQAIGARPAAQLRHLDGERARQIASGERPGI